MDRSKLIVILIISYAFLSNVALSQRHVPGYRGIGGNWGMFENKADKILALSYLSYNKRGNTWVYEIAGGETKHSNAITDVKNRQVGLNVAYLHRLLKSRGHNIYFNIGVGPVGTFEKQITSSTEEDSLNFFKENFSYGIQGIAELEVFIGSRIILLLQFKEMYIRKSFIDNTQEKATLGLRFVFP